MAFTSVFQRTGLFLFVAYLNSAKAYSVRRKRFVPQGDLKQAREAPVSAEKRAPGGPVATALSGRRAGQAMKATLLP